MPQPFEYRQVVELEISDLNNLGVGVGRIDGWVVMVPYALAGERVRASVQEPSFWYARSRSRFFVLPSL